MLFMGSMSRVNRSRFAWSGVLLAVFVAVLAWLLWPRDEASQNAPRDPAVVAPRPSAGDAKSRTERRREDEIAALVAEVEKLKSERESDKPPADTSRPFDVTVLHADGTPAVGAHVVVSAPYANAVDVGRRATTGEGGVVRLRVDDDLVRVAAWLGAEAAATEEFFAPAERSAATVRLASAVVVRGRALLDGRPVHTPTVSITVSPWMKSNFELRFRVTADADGRFEFPPIAASGLDPASPPVVDAAGAQRAAGSTTTDVEKLRRGEEVVVELARGFTVKGRLVSAAQQSWDGATVWNGNDDHWPVSLDGGFHVRLPPTGGRLVATWSEHRTDDARGAEFQGMRRNAASLGAFNGSKGDVDLGDVVVAAGRPLRGVVVEPDGKPPARARAYLYLDDVTVGRVAIDAEGRFAFPEVGPGEHVLSVMGRSADNDRGSAVVRGVKGGDDLRVVLENKTIVDLRFLADGDRRPLFCASFSLRAKIRTEGAEWFGPDVAGDPVESFEFELLGGGGYDFEINVVGYETQRFAGLQIAAGRTTPLELLLRKKRD